MGGLETWLREGADGSDSEVESCDRRPFSVKFPARFPVKLQNADVKALWSPLLSHYRVPMFVVRFTTGGKTHHDPAPAPKMLRSLSASR